jgi:alkylation response protein AidB-like acyl-CoA dehydrogenase
MISFELSEEQQLMRDAVAQFAKATLGGRVRELEAARAVPEDVRRAVHEMSLGAVDVPEQHGGQGLGLLTAVLLEEELARVDAAACFGMPGPGAFGRAVLELGNEAQASEQLAPFFAADGHERFGAVGWSEAKPCSERAGMRTVAKTDGSGWLLDGEKAYVHNAGLADRHVVFAQLDPDRGWRGLGAFVVPADSPGLKVTERYDTLGLDAGHFGALALDGVRVEATARLEPEGDFTEALLRFFTKQSLIVAARAVGLAQQAFDLARVYCDERTAFGKPIGHFQAVAFNLADRLMDVESARWLVWHAAWSWDESQGDKPCLARSARAAAHALEAAMRCGDDCVSLHGGMGFIRDALAEKLMRDAKQLMLCSATVGQLDQIAAAVELGAELDPALLLPTPDTQAIFI